MGILRSYQEGRGEGIYHLGVQGIHTIQSKGTCTKGEKTKYLEKGTLNL